MKKVSNHFCIKKSALECSRRVILMTTRKIIREMGLEDELDTYDMVEVVHMVLMRPEVI